MKKLKSPKFYCKLFIALLIAGIFLFYKGEADAAKIVLRTSEMAFCAMLIAVIVSSFSQSDSQNSLPN